MNALALRLYRLALLLLVPLALLHLWWRGRRLPAYRRHWGERFGLAPGAIAAPGQRPTVWIHAVSVGETRAAQPLVEALLARPSPPQVLMTHGTPTGRATGEQLFGTRVARCYLPYDLPGAVARFLGRHRPVAGILMETELWPHLLLEARRRGVATFLVNARLSEASARGYRRVARLSRLALEALDGVAAQAPADAARLEALGARHVVVTGSLKFDVSPPDSARDAGRRLRALAGARRPVLLAASTREGEEALLLDQLPQLAPPETLLVLVPRHPQRFEAVAALLSGAGVSFQRRSAHEPVRPETRVLLGDSMGEMFAYYAAADVAFVGGSLLPLGGQNLIEACAVGTPVLVGPHTFHFADIAAQACESGAALVVADAGLLMRQASALLADPDRRAAMGQAGLDFTRRHQGATARVMAMLDPCLPREPGPAAAREPGSRSPPPR